MKAVKILSLEEVIEQAKLIAYRNVHIPKNLRGKIGIKESDGKIIIYKIMK